MRARDFELNCHVCLPTNDDRFVTGMDGGPRKLAVDVGHVRVGPSGPQRSPAAFGHPHRPI